LAYAPTVLSNQDVGVEQFFRADDFQAYDPSPLQLSLTPKVITRPAWAGFKTAEEGRTKIMLIYT
jgi:hypothetical protein